LNTDLVLFSNSHTSTTEGFEEKIQQVQKQIVSMEKEKLEVTKNLEKMTAQYNELSPKFDRISKELQAASEALTTQKKTIAAKEKEISTLQKNLEQKSEKVVEKPVTVPDLNVVKERDQLRENSQQLNRHIEQIGKEKEALQDAIKSLKEQLEIERERANRVVVPEQSIVQDPNVNVDERILQLNEKVQQLHLENANRKLQAWEFEQDKYNIIKELQETRKKVLENSNDRKSEEQIRMLTSNLESEKITNEKLKKEVEQQSRELRELNIKMRSVKEFNEELKGEVTHLRQKLASAEKRKPKEEDENSRPKKSVVLNPSASHTLLRKQQILLDPLGSVKRSVLAIIEYFDSRVEQNNATIDTIGYGRENPYLVHIIHTQLCAALVAVFQHGFNGPFWLLTTSHYWHMIEEIVDSYQNVPENSQHELPAEQLLVLELRKAVRTVNSIVTREIQAELKAGNTHSPTSPSVIPQNEHELKFRALVICLLNEKQLSMLFKFLMHDKHRAFWKRFYDQNALLRQLECQNKLITYLTLLVKLPFTIDIETVCSENSYVRIDDAIVNE
jgi:predicted  nucleic acid-binding Zn-ribbon protein